MADFFGRICEPLALAATDAGEAVRGAGEIVCGKKIGWDVG